MLYGEMGAHRGFPAVFFPERKTVLPDKRPQPSGIRSRKPGNGTAEYSEKCDLAGNGEPEGIRPDISDKIQIENEPAAFLLCNDGLWEGVEEDKMEKLLARSCTPEEWLENLRKELSMAGLDAYDNNSAAAVFIR